MYSVILDRIAIKKHLKRTVPELSTLVERYVSYPVIPPIQIAWESFPYEVARKNLFHDITIDQLLCYLRFVRVCPMTRQLALIFKKVCQRIKLKNMADDRTIIAYMYLLTEYMQSRNREYIEYIIVNNPDRETPALMIYLLKHIDNLPELYYKYLYRGNMCSGLFRNIFKSYLKNVDFKEEMYDFFKNQYIYSEINPITEVEFLQRLYGKPRRGSKVNPPINKAAICDVGLSEQPKQSLNDDTTMPKKWSSKIYVRMRDPEPFAGTDQDMNLWSLENEEAIELTISTPSLSYPEAKISDSDQNQSSIISKPFLESETCKTPLINSNLKTMSSFRRACNLLPMLFNSCELGPLALKTIYSPSVFRTGSIQFKDIVISRSVQTVNHTELVQFCSDPRDHSWNTLWSIMTEGCEKRTVKICSKRRSNKRSMRRNKRRSNKRSMRRSKRRSNRRSMRRSKRRSNICSECRSMRCSIRRIRRQTVARRTFSTWPEYSKISTSVCITNRNSFKEMTNLSKNYLRNKYLKTKYDTNLKYLHASSSETRFSSGSIRVSSLKRRSQSRRTTKTELYPYPVIDRLYISESERSTSTPIRKKLLIKQTLTTILREAATVLTQELREQNRYIRLLQGSSNYQKYQSSAKERLQKEQNELQQRLKEMYYKGQMTHRAAILAKERLVHLSKIRRKCFESERKKLLRHKLKNIMINRKRQIMLKIGVIYLKHRLNFKKTVMKTKKRRAALLLSKEIKSLHLQAKQKKKDEQCRKKMQAKDQRVLNIVSLAQRKRMKSISKVNKDWILDRNFFAFMSKQRESVDKLQHVDDIRAYTYVIKQRAIKYLESKRQRKCTSIRKSCSVHEQPLNTILMQKNVVAYADQIVHNFEQELKNLPMLNHIYKMKEKIKLLKQISEKLLSLLTNISTGIRLNERLSAAEKASIHIHFVLTLEKISEVIMPGARSHKTYRESRAEKHTHGLRKTVGVSSNENDPTEMKSYLAILEEQEEEQIQLKLQQETETLRGKKQSLIEEEAKCVESIMAAVHEYLLYFVKFFEKSNDPVKVAFNFLQKKLSTVSKKFTQLKSAVRKSAKNKEKRKLKEKANKPKCKLGEKKIAASNPSLHVSFSTTDKVAQRRAPVYNKNSVCPSFCQERTYYKNSPVLSKLENEMIYGRLKVPVYNKDSVLPSFCQERTYNKNSPVLSKLENEKKLGRLKVPVYNKDSVRPSFCQERTFNKNSPVLSKLENEKKLGRLKVPVYNKDSVRPSFCQERTYNKNSPVISKLENEKKLGRLKVPVHNKDSVRPSFCQERTYKNHPVLTKLEKKYGRLKTDQNKTQIREIKTLPLTNKGIYNDLSKNKQPISLPSISIPTKRFTPKKSSEVNQLEKPIYGLVLKDPFKCIWEWEPVHLPENLYNVKNHKVIKPSAIAIKKDTGQLKLPPINAKQTPSFTSPLAEQFTKPPNNFTTQWKIQLTDFGHLTENLRAAYLQKVSKYVSDYHNKYGKYSRPSKSTVYIPI